MKLIDADALIERMYHDAFETDTDMQKWDGAFWIRYKMFENAMDSAPTIDAVEVVRCKDCKYADLHDGEYRLCLLTGTWKKLDHFCSDGERKNDEIQTH